MKNKKTGYTLAEVLLTLGIIGVLAAMVVPSVHGNAEKATIGPSLYKAVEQIESGMRSIMQAATDRAEQNQGINDQTEISTVTTTLDTITYRDITGGNNTHIITSANMFGDFRGYVGADTLTADERAYLREARNFRNNANISATYPFIANNTAYRFPGNKAVFVYEPAVDNSINNYAALHNNYLPEDVVIARIMIDANGEKTPNQLGRDIFLFGLTNNGHLVPAGSNSYNRNVFNNGNGADIPLYTAECRNNNITTGASCAARVATDNWDVKYK